ncbi:RapZ C-terminal domain-containing protein [Fructilactobacillus sp. Tb1]|uniref:RapZ C-terminal domain-containing protein n=1 Tax=Fructilactobacillus sp. Tb1 TaxID=3422304 RepID=UPI003D2A7B64
MKNITLESFSYRKGLPNNHPDLTFDVRSLPDPYDNLQLRPLSGLDQPVQEFIAKQKAAQELLLNIIQQIKSHPDAQIVAIGCTGGHHRSVAMVEMTAIKLRDLGYQVTIKHTNLF